MSKSVDWFLYDSGLRHKRLQGIYVKYKLLWNQHSQINAAYLFHEIHTKKYRNNYKIKCWNLSTSATNNLLKNEKSISFLFFLFFLTESDSLAKQMLYGWMKLLKISSTFHQHLLRAVAFFEFILAFSHFKNFKFACYLEGFHLQIALNLLKHALFICTPCMSLLTH